MVEQREQDSFWSLVAAAMGSRGEKSVVKTQEGFLEEADHVAGGEEEGSL